MRCFPHSLISKRRIFQLQINFPLADSNTASLDQMYTIKVVCLSVAAIQVTLQCTKIEVRYSGSTFAIFMRRALLNINRVTMSRSALQHFTLPI